MMTAFLKYMCTVGSGATYRIHKNPSSRFYSYVFSHEEMEKVFKRVRQAKNYKSIPFTYNINGITFINKITL